VPNDPQEANRAETVTTKAASMRRLIQVVRAKTLAHEFIVKPTIQLGYIHSEERFRREASN
jgi:hypothetical protein